jgi:hypothetical protein
VTPKCWCGESSRVADIPQTKKQFEEGRDTYICKANHVFEGTIPLKLENDVAVRADM